MSLRERLHEIVFEAETPAGKVFDVVLLVLILASVVALSIESVPGIAENYGTALFVAEWAFTGLFTIEYLTRLSCVKRPMSYALSFFGIIDLIAVLPAYVALFLVDAHGLATVRILRLVRVFRVLKLVRFVGEARVLHVAMRASLPKITVFLLAILCLVVVIGSVMHVVEGEENGIDSIPRGIYWAIVTLTTVGYGDISPNTAWGQTLAAFVMMMGYAIIAVPTGIVSSELVRGQRESTTTKCCPRCATDAQLDDAIYCRRCGEKL